MSVESISSFLKGEAEGGNVIVLRKLFMKQLQGGDFKREVDSLLDEEIDLLEERLRKERISLPEKILTLVVLFVRYGRKAEKEFKELLDCLRSYYLDLQNLKNEELIHLACNVLFLSLLWGSRFYKKNELVLREIGNLVNEYINLLENVDLESLYEEDFFNKSPLFLYWILMPLIQLLCDLAVEDDTKRQKVREIFLKYFDFYVEKGMCYEANVLIEEIVSCKGNSFLSREEYEECLLKIGDCYYLLGKRLFGVKGFHYLNIALQFFERAGQKDKIDRLKVEIYKKEEEILLKEKEYTLPQEVEEKLRCNLEKLKHKVLEKLKEEGCIEALGLIVNPFSLPNRDLVNKSVKESSPIMYSLASVIPITEARVGYLNSKEEYEKFQKAQLLQMLLFISTMNFFIPVVELLIENLGKRAFVDCVLKLYRNSFLYEPQREGLLEAVIKSFVDESYSSVNLVLIPNIEHMLKVFFLKNGINIFDRKAFKLEAITLNAILSQDNRREIIERYFGKEFYDLLWLMFEYEYGLNMRNALMHGEGLIYTSKYYVYLVFFVFLYLLLYTQVYVPMQPEDC